MHGLGQAQVYGACATVLLIAGCGGDNTTYSPSENLEACLEAVSERTGSEDMHFDGPSRDGEVETYVLSVSGGPSDEWKCEATPGSDGPTVQVRRNG